MFPIADKAKRKLKFHKLAINALKGLFFFNGLYESS